jgi:probable HAF family extracellular repeat protein
LLIFGTAGAARAGAYTFQSVPLPISIPNPGTPTPNTQLGAIADGINDLGQVVGAYYTTSGTYGFEYSNSQFTTINVPGSAYPDTAVNAINNSGVMVGTYYPLGSTSLFTGFIYDGAAFNQLNDPSPGILMVRPLGINNNGVIVGDLDVNGNDEGFIYNGTFKGVSPLGAPNSRVTGINDSGIAVGWLLSPSVGGQYGAFMYNGTSYSQLIDPSRPNALVLADSINDAGMVVGTSTLPGGITDGFIYDIGTSTWTYLDVAGAIATSIYGINNEGEIVGDYQDSSDPYYYYAFIGSPVPEPSSLALTAIGTACAAVSYLWRRRRAGSSPIADRDNAV